jgi:penicillin-binding protein 2
MKWKEYLNEFGFGKKLGIELTNELPGNVPSTAYFDRYYGKNRWKALTVISMAIGQGELGTTPLQMANMTCNSKQGLFLYSSYRKINWYR